MGKRSKANRRRLSLRRRALQPSPEMAALAERVARKLEERDKPKPPEFDFQAAERSYREFMETDYDPDPLRRYVRAHGGHCSGGGGCC